MYDVYTIFVRQTRNSQKLVANGHVREPDILGQCCPARVVDPHSIETNETQCVLEL